MHSVTNPSSSPTGTGCRSFLAFLSHKQHNSTGFVHHTPEIRTWFSQSISLAAFAILSFLYGPLAISAPAGSWNTGTFGGSWDGIFSCTFEEGITNLTIGEFDTTTSSATQEGAIKCTFTPPSIDGVVQPTIGPADCTLQVEFSNLTPVCDGTGTLNIDGPCPSTIVTGSVDCGADNAANTDGLPAGFCTYAGNDPEGNTSGECIVNLGVLDAQGNPLTSKECGIALPDGVFSLALTYGNTDCTGGLTSFGEVQEDFCHSDTFDPSVAAACDIDNKNKTLKHPAASNNTVGLQADIDINKAINTNCNNNSGKVTLTVYSEPQDATCTNCVALDVTAIDPSSLTLNGWDVLEGTVSTFFDDILGINVLTAQFPQCMDGDSIVNEILDGYAVMTMTAQIGVLDSLGEFVVSNSLTGTELASVTSAGTLVDIDNVTADEGDIGNQNYEFSVSLTKASSNDITVYYDVIDETATVGEDYNLVTSGSVLIPAGATTADSLIVVEVLGDNAAEDDETFKVVLGTIDDGGSNDTGYLNNTGTGTITNDDFATISVDNVTLYEGDRNETTPFVFNVTLTGEVGNDVTLDFVTVDGTAVSTGRNKDRDYVTAIGTLIIPAGSNGATKQVTVNVNGDTASEPDETFTLELSGALPGGVSFSDSQGTGTILNDD